MKYLSCLVITLVFLFIGSAFAAPETSNQFPTELMYSGKPIDPLCFSILKSGPNVISLQDCPKIEGEQ